MQPIKVFLADDHNIVRDGIKSILKDIDDIEVIGEAADGQAAVEQIKVLNPEVAILDIRMPKLNGIETVAVLRDISHNVKTLILTMHDTEEYVLRSIENGAYGYILKDAAKEEFIMAIKTVALGEKYYSPSVSKVLVNNYLNRNNQPETQKTYAITKREQEILKYLEQGLSNKDIAVKFGKSVRTVETHRFKMMKKLNAKNAIELIKIAKEHKLV
ncbi:MAG: response regulator transcription factor [Bacteroidales bacterium]|nr:response regulator transcription factor [Bacteroidales bacterium]